MRSADLQGLERKASLKGEMEDFNRLRERIEVCYADIVMFRGEINFQRAVIATKIMPMIDRVMSGEYRSLADEISLPKQEEGEEVMDEQSSFSEESIAAATPLPIHQPLTALDRYELGLVFAGVKHEKEIIDLLRWLISEDFAKRLSQFILRIEEDSFEMRLAEVAELKKWRLEAQIRARRLVHFLIEALPIWTSHNLSIRQIGIRIDQEGKLQQFLIVLDWRFKERVAQREQLQESRAAWQRKVSTANQAHKSSQPIPQENNQKVIGNLISYSGRRVSLPRDLIGKESNLLDYVSLGHFFGNSQTGRSYSLLKRDGYVFNLEQTLRQARAKTLVVYIEQQIVINGGPPQGRSVKGLVNHARRIEESVALLSIFTADGKLDKGKAIERAYDILTTQEGSNAYTVMRIARGARVNK